MTPVAAGVGAIVAATADVRAPKEVRTLLPTSHWRVPAVAAVTFISGMPLLGRLLQVSRARTTLMVAVSIAVVMLVSGAQAAIAIS